MGARRIVLALATLAVALAGVLAYAPGWAAAEQTIWFDQSGSWPGGSLEQKAPENMRAPNDYTSGKVYLRYEAIKKPTNFPVKVQICVWQDSAQRESCGPFLHFEDKGVHYAVFQPPSTWWNKNADTPIDYTRLPQWFRLVHKDGDGNQWVDTCGGSHCMGARAAPHIPIEYNVTAYVTTQGHLFEPPADWECPASWECGDSSNTAQTSPSSSSDSSACNLVQAGGPVPAGFAAPYNVLSASQEMLVSVTCPSTSSGQATLTAGTGAQNQYVYQSAYTWRNNQWQQINLAPSITSGQAGQLVGGAWYVGSAQSRLPQTAAELSQNNFVVAYVCTWTGAQWKCGCRNQQCAQGLWQLQVFRHGSGQIGDGGQEQDDGLVGGLTTLARERPRILISTDATRCDFDDAHTMIMTLLFADLLRIEGVIVSPPNCGWPNNIDDALDAYEADYSKLAQHGDFPPPQELQGVYRAQGGENLIIEKAHEGSAEDPLWIGVWGSHTDVADALRKDPSIKSKIRLFGNGLGWNYEQDKASRDYIWREHPDLYWIDVLTTDLENNHLGDGLFRQHMNQAWYNENVRGAGALGALADRQGKGGNPPCVNCESKFGPRDIGQGVLYLLGNDVADPTIPGWDGVYEKYEDGVHENFWVYSDDPQFRTDGFDARVPFAEGMEEWVPMLAERFGWLE